MSSEIIPCPACKHPVRVPESLFGQAVRCPECKTYFTAPTRNVDGQLGEPILLPDPPPHTMRPARVKTPLSASPLQVPGLFLLLVGIIGTAVNGVVATLVIVDQDTFIAIVVKALKDNAEHKKQEFDEDAAKQSLKAMAPILVAAAGISLIPLLGAVAMLRMRFWRLAVTGSIVAIVNFSNGCCLIGLPVGIYCLIKLFDPEIREIFRRG